MPVTAFVVRRVYPPIVWRELADGRRETVTPRAAAAADAALAAAEDAAAATVATQLVAEDAAHASRLAAAVADDVESATEGELAYAREWRSAHASGAAAPSVPPGARTASPALDRYCATLDRRREARAAELRAAALEAAGVTPPTRAARVVRALVSAALPPHLPPTSLDAEWLLSWWNPPDDAPPLVEGGVYVATALTPRPAPGGGDARACPGLATTRATRVAHWPATGPPPVFACPPRRTVTLATLAGLALGDDFDFEGVVVGAGAPRVLTPRGDIEQWAFLADAAAASLVRDAGVPPDAVWLLAVRISGAAAAAPVVPPGASGRAVSLRDARLATAPDGAALLWRAEARDTAHLTVAPEEGEAGAWAVATFGGRVAALLGE